MTQHISYINVLDEQIIPSIITMENDYVNCVDSYILKNRVIHVRILDNNSTNTELEDDDLLPLLRQYVNNILKNSKQINEATNQQKTIQIYMGTFCPLKHQNNRVKPMPGIFRP